MNTRKIITIAKKYGSIIDEDNINEKIEEIITKSESILATKDDLEKINTSLEKIMRYPLLVGIENIEDVKDFRYPYCHVHRYGGKNDGITDNSKAIQLCINITEKNESKRLFNIPC